MKKHLLAFLMLIACRAILPAQGIGIGTSTPDSSALLDISGNVKGILIPRMSTASLNAIHHPAKGLMAYDSTTNELMVNMGTAAVPDWKTIAHNSSWLAGGNAGTNPATHFMGTTDNKPLLFRVNNKPSGRIDSLGWNTFIGFRAGGAATATNNTAIGYKSLHSNGTGVSNTAVGAVALSANTIGKNNSAFGDGALSANTNADNNTAFGSKALNLNVTGLNNTACGSMALKANTLGNNNTAFGNDALKASTSGNHNVAVGHQAADHNTTGSLNTAVGTNALNQNTGGFRNCAAGALALAANTTGSENTALGADALRWMNGSSNNTMVGSGAGEFNNLGWNNTFIGSDCNGNAAGIFNSVALGNAITITASNQARIGNSSTTSIGGYAGWTNLSDGRYKKNIREDVKGLAFILKLRPVTYQLDVTGLRRKYNESDENLRASGMEAAIAEKERQIQSGFIAQEVEAAAVGSGYDFSGVDRPKNEEDLYGLRYAEFVVPMIKAMQEQQAQIEDLRKQVGDLTAKLLTVSAKIAATE